VAYFLRKPGLKSGAAWGSSPDLMWTLPLDTGYCWSQACKIQRLHVFWAFSYRIIGYAVVFASSSNGGISKVPNMTCRKVRLLLKARWKPFSSRRNGTDPDDRFVWSIREVFCPLFLELRAKFFQLFRRGAKFYACV
jgi:hypothetical protein